MKIIQKLPHWVISNPSPSFYETEGGTVLEQTGIMYKKVQELIDEYNSFQETSTTEQEDFKAELTKIIHDYIKMLDEKIKLQDFKIEDTVVYIKNNIEDSVTNILTEMKESGELDSVILDNFNNLSSRIETLENTEYTLEHDSETEQLRIVKVVGGVE